MFFCFFTVVEKLREMMEEIENAINTFKEEQRLMYVSNPSNIKLLTFFTTSL